jgi:hypothetical protein
MEIVPVGSPKPDIQLQYFCSPDIIRRGCGTEFRFWKSEGITGYCHDDGAFVFINCPACNKEHQVWL